MADNLNSGQFPAADCFKESVCIHTSKIFDSCRDKDCIEDLRVFPTCGSQAVIDAAFSIRPRTAKLLYADVRVEEIHFNRGCYTVDVTYFYKVTGEAFPGEKLVSGLTVFDKRVVLYGGEGGSMVFSSRSGCMDHRHSSLPTAVVESVDPLCLSMKIVDKCTRDLSLSTRDIPPELMSFFDDDLVTSATGKQLFTTLGQFSIIRLERNAQLLMPVYDYHIPDKECSTGGGVEEDPSSLFAGIPFPMNDFFPPRGNPNKCAEDGKCGS